jgi:hypothetical protein
MLIIDEKLGIRMLDLVKGSITTIAYGYLGQNFTSLNSITFAEDSNTAYFTHSSDFSMDSYHLELLYKTGTGKVY